MNEVSYVWWPQPGPQHAFITCPIFDVLFGGARGGGKSDACLGEFALHAQRHGVHASGVFIRREMPQADSLIERSHQIYNPLGWDWHEQKKQWTATNGAILKFRPLESDRDAEKFQGQQFTRVYVEELTNFAEPKPIDKLKACLRSAAGVPVAFRATTNPGGPGHTWVKRRYVDPAPTGYEVLKDETGQPDRIFIPSKVWDNAILLSADPAYVERLKLSGSAQLVKAWLDGDWSAVEGAFFDCWSSELHVVEPFAIPKHWLRFRSMDWGSASPASIGWWAVASDDHHVHGKCLPRGALVRYREWYIARDMGGAMTGEKLTAEEIAKGIAKRESGEKIDYGVLDPSAFAWDSGPSIAERMANAGVVFHRADNKRVAAKGAIGGWDMVRQRLVGNADGRPMLYVFSACRDFIRTVPNLQHDPDRPEDLDTRAEDHIADETRYACMSRPWIREAPKAAPKIKSMSEMTFGELEQAMEKINRRSGGSEERI